MYFFYFYPLGLDRDTSRPPVLTRLLTVVMAVAFLWLRYRPEPLALHPAELIFHPGNGAPWTAVTALFLHGGWWHLLGNLVYLNVFGPPLEDRLGPGLYLAVFLLAGSFGNLVHGLVSVWGLMGQTGTGVMGASGSLAGLLAVTLVRFWKARVRIGWWVFAPLAGQNRAGLTCVPVVAAALLWLGLQAVHALAAGETGTGVSYGAHLGGFLSGLSLALVLGQLAAGRAENHRVQARRYFTDGHYHAAAGAWTEYLAMAPGDLEGLLGRARCRRLLGRRHEGLADYRRALEELLARGRIDELLEVFRECRRAELARELPAELLTAVAAWMEKELDFEGALAAYRDLFESYPEQSAGQRALVRLVHLYHGKLDEPEEARRWLGIACRKLPGGSWRQYLVREFSLEAEPGEGDPADRPEPDRKTVP